MDRMTRHKDEWPCRIDKCEAENWVLEIQDDYCSTCPFEKYINKLAEYEDLAELMEDDRK